MQVTVREEGEIAFAEHNEDLRNAVRHAVGEGGEFARRSVFNKIQKNALAPPAGMR
jgi:hypothetical protein